MEKNRESPSGHARVDLKSVAIGNGIFDPSVQFGGWRDFMASNSYGVKFPQQSMLDAMTNAWEGPGNCRDQLKECYKRSQDEGNRVCYQALTFCEQNVGGAYDTILGLEVSNREVQHFFVILAHASSTVHVQPYDVRRLANDTTPFPPKHYEGYLAKPAVRAALGVAITYVYGSPVVYSGFTWAADNARAGRSSVENLRWLLDQGVAVSLYVGDADYRCNLNGQTEIAKLVGGAGFEKAGWADVASADGVVHAQVKQAGLFSFVQVYVSALSAL